MIEMVEDLKPVNLCIVTGDETDFSYKHKPLKKEIYTMAKQLAKEFNKGRTTHDRVGIADAVDTIALHMQKEVKLKIHNHKQELQKEVDELEKEVENES